MPGPATGTPVAPYPFSEPTQYPVVQQPGDLHQSVGLTQPGALQPPGLAQYPGLGQPPGLAQRAAIGPPPGLAPPPDLVQYPGLAESPGYRQPPVPGNPTAGRHSDSSHRSGSTRRGNGFATTALVFGILPAPVLGIGFGITGLVRFRRNGRGRARSVTGIVLGLVWAGLFVYVTPHLMKAVDPGCSSFKGATMTAYDKVIGDLNASAAPSTLVPNINTAIADLDSAAVMSKNAAAKSALTNLAAQLSAVRAGAANGTVTSSDMTALNADGSAADNACGTL